MGSRPEFGIAEFVRVRRDFDDGRGPAEAWARLNEVSMWRLDELAERAGSRRWAMLVAPPDSEPSSQDNQRRLLHALRSTQIAASALPTFWRFGQLRISMSYVVVAHQAELQQAVRLAQRYGQIVVAHVQRIPFEHIAVHDVATERSVEIAPFDPTLIRQRLASSVGAADVAMVYRCATRGECLAMLLVEQKTFR